jgi:hypothetical protein
MIARGSIDLTTERRFESHARQKMPNQGVTPGHTDTWE